MATKWKKGNRADLLAALSKSLKHLPKLSAQDLKAAKGVEFEFRLGPLGIVCHSCCGQLKFKPDGIVGPKCGPIIYNPFGIPSHGCAPKMKPAGIVGPRCSPTLRNEERNEMVVCLRSLVKKKKNKPR